jgi:hypothetical protein
MPWTAEDAERHTKKADSAKRVPRIEPLSTPPNSNERSGLLPDMSVLGHKRIFLILLFPE